MFITQGKGKTKENTQKDGRMSGNNGLSLRDGFIAVGKQNGREEMH